MLTVYRLDNLIMEAITNLKEPAGSNKTTIGTYIEVILPHIFSFAGITYASQIGGL